MKIADVRTEVLRWLRGSRMASTRTPTVDSTLFTSTPTKDLQVWGVGALIQDTPEVGVATVGYLKRVHVGRSPLDEERYLV